MESKVKCNRWEKIGLRERESGKVSVDEARPEVDRKGRRNTLEMEAGRKKAIKVANRRHSLGALYY
jgi:hypothetical protein